MPEYARNGFNISMQGVFVDESRVYCAWRRPNFGHLIGAWFAPIECLIVEGNHRTEPNSLSSLFTVLYLLQSLLTLCISAFSSCIIRPCDLFLVTSSDSQPFPFGVRLTPSLIRAETGDAHHSGHCEDLADFMVKCVGNGVAGQIGPEPPTSVDPWWRTLPIGWSNLSIWWRDLTL